MLGFEFFGGEGRGRERRERKGGRGERERILRTYVRGQVLFLLHTYPSVIVPPIMPLPQHILYAATISASSSLFFLSNTRSGKREEDEKESRRTHHTMQPMKHAQPPQIPPSSLFCQRNRLLVIAP